MAASLPANRIREDYRSRFFASGIATFTWLARASGWSGFHTFTAWNLKQGPSQTVLGLSVDLDESQGHGGGFQVALVEG